MHDEFLANDHSDHRGAGVRLLRLPIVLCLRGRQIRSMPRETKSRALFESYQYHRHDHDDVSTLHRCLDSERVDHPETVLLEEIPKACFRQWLQLPVPDDVAVGRNAFTSGTKTGHSTRR